MFFAHTCYHTCLFSKHKERERERERESTYIILTNLTICNGRLRDYCEYTIYIIKWISFQWIDWYKDDEVYECDASYSTFILRLLYAQAMRYAIA